MNKLFHNLIIILLDFFLLIFTFFITEYLTKTTIKIDFVFFIIAVVFFLFYYEKIYHLRYDFWQETKKIYKALFISYLISITAISLSKINYPLEFITLYFLLLFLFFPFLKRYGKKLLYSFDFFKIKVKLIGHKNQMDDFKNEIENNWYLGMKNVEENYDSIIVSSKYMSTEQMDQIISEYLKHNRELFIIPYITQINFANSNILEYNNIRYNTIQIENKLLIKKNIFIKDSFDFVVSLLLLPIFVPIHIVISILIKLDSPGSIFFLQKRVGKDLKKFTCYKYRTMYEDSNEILKEYLKKNPDEIKYYEKYHKYKNDPRITKIGKILRATSLDELPQIFNILKKEMSLVGPRPYMPEELKNIGKYKEFIFKVKPGITGLWQVSGRNNLPFKKRVELDVWYIKNWSLWADFVILIKTIKVVLLKIGAK